MRGLGVSQGIGIGKAFIVEKKDLIIEKKHIIDANVEIVKFKKALENVKNQINDLYLKTLNEVGEKEAQIFKSHELILEDETFVTEVEYLITNENLNAEFAINQKINIYVKMFENINDEYLRERALDIKDVMTLVIKELLGINSTNYSRMQKNSIVVAKDLTPSDTARLDRNKVTAMITEIGSKTSHAAILAKMLGIPTVVGIEGIIDKVKSNDTVICDGNTGIVLINPNPQQLSFYQKKMEDELKINNELKSQVGLPTVTNDGFKVELASNIGSPNDVQLAIDNDAEGIGLYRSEFIFMNRDCSPTEEEQYEVYKEVLVKMKDKPVIIRTLDIGGDKEVPYLGIPKEVNPFLGYRAIRLCLGNTDIFRTQLRAILRASIYGNVKIMFPMIATLKEIKDAKKILEEAMEELRQDNIPFKEDIEIGIMVEIPSAAIISDVLAKEVDFFSIGTNDLIQYTMAVDRMNSKMAYLYSQYHPALLKLIKTIIDNGHKAGIWVGMCGEAAGDPNLIPVFIGMGLDEFSMNSPQILRARYMIRRLNKKDMKELAENILNMDYAMEIESYLSNMFAAKKQLHDVI